MIIGRAREAQRVAILVPSDSRNRFTLLLVQARSGLVFDAGLEVVQSARRRVFRLRPQKGPTKEKLYNEVKQRGIRDRASMTKEQPRKAIEAKK